MKSLSNNRKGEKSILKTITSILFMTMLANYPLYGAEILNNISILETNKNELMFFPYNEIKDYNITVDSNEIVNIDLYDFELEKDNQIIMNPNSKVKLMRLSQVSESPKVVRANIVFNNVQKINPQSIKNRIVINVDSPNEISEEKEQLNDNQKDPKSLKNNEEENNISDKMAQKLLFRDLNIKDSLQILSKMMNINLIIHESVEDKKINFYIENLSLSKLFDLLLETNGLVKKYYGNNTYVVFTKESAIDFGEKIFKTFKLNYSKPDEIIGMIKNNKSLSKSIKINNLFANPRLNSLSVFDSQENVALMEKIVQSADIKGSQATIEFKLDLN